MYFGKLSSASGLLFMPVRIIGCLSDRFPVRYFRFVKLEDEVIYLFYSVLDKIEV